MSKGYILESNSYNPYTNLATEKWLMEIVAEQKAPVLFLWQNDKTVVIGRNQNVYTECDIKCIEENKCYIARRYTGGGAVYHDKGNLNYSIILPKKKHDITTSTQMIVNILRNLHIEAVANGRNDICINGMKISGNAYYSNEEVGLHHGTLLLSTDLEMMNNVLSVPQYKRTYKGIKSIRSRVVNIGQLYPDVLLEDLKNEFRKTFFQYYSIEEQLRTEFDWARIRYLAQELSSAEWIFDKVKTYNESVCIISEQGTMILSADFEGKKKGMCALYLISWMLMQLMRLKIILMEAYI